MNERFQVTDKDLVFWKKGTEKIIEKYLQENKGLPKTFVKKILGLFSPTPGITLSCLYDNTLNKRIMPCFAGNQIVHIDPTGNIFPCNFKLSKDRILGNLRDKTFDEIWESAPPSILEEIKNGECMYPNGLCGDSDIYPSTCNAPPFLIKWYLNKLLKRRPFIEVKEDGKK